MANRLTGEAAKPQQRHSQWTSNNTKNRNSISVVSRVIERSELLRKICDVWQYIDARRQYAAAATACERVPV